MSDYIKREDAIKKIKEQINHRLRDIAWDFPPEHSINRAADMLTVLQAENNKLQDELKCREAEIARLNEAREIANEKAREYEKRAGLVEQKRKSDMKRLTIRNSDGTVSQPTTTSIEALFYRLAAYEDTGLEPEEIVKLYKENEELINATMVLRKTDNQKKQTVTYEMEYNAELSHENVRTIAKIIFDNLMKADLKHRMGDIISDDYNFDRLRELAKADRKN